MSRFGENEEGMPWELWETVVSNSLGGRKGQEALAAMETALLALPEPVLVHGHLALDGKVCAIGAFVAHHRAQEQGVDIATVIDAMGAGVQCWCGHGRDVHAEGKCAGTRSWDGKPCTCDEYDPSGNESDYETVLAGKTAGLSHTIAWHLAYLNDEQFDAGTPAERYEKMLAWVQRAQGKTAAGAVPSGERAPTDTGGTA